MSIFDQFIDLTHQSILDGTFVKLTLSKNRLKSESLLNVYARLVEIKSASKISFTYHYQTKDETQNFDVATGLRHIRQFLENQFKSANLITQSSICSLMTSKKGKATIHTTVQKQAISGIPDQKLHDRPKKKYVLPESPYLQALKVSDSDGKVIPKMADKYRQINKYLEIVDGLLDQVSLPDRPIHVVDMGSGKGYLTFALYDYLTIQRRMRCKVTGIELRKDMVSLCNDAARACGFDGLSFIDQRIEHFQAGKVDVLIALHACDTATDDALAKGLKDRAELIICAPCCHKQIRQQLKGKEQSDPILKYGIFKERQYEMVTDTIRALILEREGYESKVFEFVSNEHTRKNVMLVGVNKHKPDATIQPKIEAVKRQYQIDFQYLEKLL